jgi:phosphoribosylaminoimidazole-succinocarboxamide synthase
MENNFQGKAGQQVPEMTSAIVEGITNRYIELYENITGDAFIKSEEEDVASRIEKNVLDYLEMKI